MFGIDRAEMEIQDNDGPAVVTPAGASSATGTTTSTSTGLLVAMPFSKRSNITVSAGVTCADGSAPTSVSLHHLGGSFSMALVGPALYQGTIPSTQVGTGPFKVSATCGLIVTTTTIGSIVLFDPSGAVTDAVTRAPVVGAQVTLLRVPGWQPRRGPDDSRPETCESNASKPAGAPWSQPAPVHLGVLVDPVADAARFEPDLNPETTNVDGWYGWDVAAGCWFVTVTADGYRTLISPVVGVPPAVTDLNLALRPATADATAPTVSASASPEPNSAGWSRTDVTVTLSAADEAGGSGLHALTYSATGAQPVGETSDPDGEAAIQITTEGVTVISFFARDLAGNLSPAGSVTVSLDKTPPTLACSACPDSLWPPNHELVAITTTVSLLDELAGPDRWWLTGAASDEPDNGQGDGDTAGDLQGWETGTADSQGMVRAERSGKGSDRTYTLGYRGVDQAGNTATCAATVVVPHDGR